MIKLVKQLAVISIILILAVGCGTKKQDTDKGKTSEPITPKTQNVTLYFLDSNGKQFVPEERQLPSGDTLFESIVKELLNGPKEPGVLPVITRNVDKSILESANWYDTNGIMVKFKGNAKEYLDKSPAFIEAMVLSLTQIKGVEKVAVEVNNIPYDDKNKGIYVRKVKCGPVYVSKDRQERLKNLAKSGEGDWLYDPVKVAQKEAGAFGFLPDDEYVLVSKKDHTDDSGTSKAYVNVKHDGKEYTIQLFQPSGTGERGIWILDSISKKVTPIPETNPKVGEAFIYGRVKSIDPGRRLIVIDREYMDSPDTRVKAGPEIYVLDDAIIHYQQKIGMSATGYIYNEYDVDFKDIKLNDELGIIITKDKKARAIIISGR